jgi:phytanoyl-CoA hydroxylase
MEELLSKTAQTFNEFGFVILKNVFTPEECNSLKLACKKLLAGLPVNKTGVNVWGAANIPEIFMKFLKHEKIKSALEEIWEGPVELLSTKTVFKSKEVEFSSPWHQDRPYWNGCLKISGWISLDNATIENGCLKIVPASHTTEYAHKQFKETIGFGNRLTLDKESESKSTPVILNQGDVLLFSDLLLHSSYPNTNQKDRWCLIPTYRKMGMTDNCLKLNGIWNNPIPL